MYISYIVPSALFSFETWSPLHSQRLLFIVWQKLLWNCVNSVSYLSVWNSPLHSSSSSFDSSSVCHTAHLISSHLFGCSLLLSPVMFTLWWLDHKRLSFFSFSFFYPSSFYRRIWRQLCVFPPLLCWQVMVLTVSAGASWQQQKQVKLDWQH